MKAMILAAGYGRRMGVLTESMPKPLLKLHGRALIEHSLFCCQRAGITDVVINVHYHAEQLMAFLGDGDRYGMSIQYSDERDQLLGTGGGIVRALPLLGEAPFVLLSSDIVTDFSLAALPTLNEDHLAHLVLVNNPEHHPQGDFALQAGFITYQGARFTYANIALLSPRLFQGEQVQPADLVSILNKAIGQSKVTGEFFNGHWFNVGTAEILEALHARAGKPMLGGCPKKRAT